MNPQEPQQAPELQNTTPQPMATPQPQPVVAPASQPIAMQQPQPVAPPQPQAQPAATLPFAPQPQPQPQNSPSPQSLPLTQSKKKVTQGWVGFFLAIYILSVLAYTIFTISSLSNSYIVPALLYLVTDVLVIASIIVYIKQKRIAQPSTQEHILHQLYLEPFLSQ